MLDPPNQKVGDIEEVTFDKKVLKEILEVGEGVKHPKRNFIAKINYKAYFYDHLEFDQGTEVSIALGDASWPEGLWLGIEKMRKNEVAKIKIKKKHGFGRKFQVEKLNFPKGYETEGKSRTRILTKGIIYEVKLLDWTQRVDIEADGNFLKEYLVKADKKDYEKPADRDELILDMTVT